MEVASVLRPVLATRFPTLFADLAREVRMPVRIVVSGAEETDVAMLVERPLLARDSTHLQLAALAPYTVETTPGAIERYNQQYRRYVSIDYRGPFRMGNEFLQQELESFYLRAGYSIDRTSLSFFTADTTRAVGWGLPATSRPAALVP